MHAVLELGASAANAMDTRVIQVEVWLSGIVACREVQVGDLLECRTAEVCDPRIRLGAGVEAGEGPEVARRVLERCQCW